MIRPAGIMEHLMRSSYRYNRERSPDIAVESWRLVYGERLDALEAEYQAELNAERESSAIDRAMLRSAAEALTDTETITEAEIVQELAEAQGKCEFCPDRPGVRCCVCCE